MKIFLLLCGKHNSVFLRYHVGFGPVEPDKFLTVVRKSGPLMPWGCPPEQRRNCARSERVRVPGRFPAATWNCLWVAYLLRDELGKQQGWAWRVSQVKMWTLMMVWFAVSRDAGQWSHVSLNLIGTAKSYNYEYKEVSFCLWRAVTVIFVLGTRK